MSSSALKRGIVACTATVVAATALIVGAGAASAATPPYEPDPSAVGTLAFYDSSGNVVTSGSTSVAPFASYAVGSATPRAGDAQAELLFANPDPGSTPVNWYGEQVGLYNRFPLTSGPASLQAMDASHPAVAGGAGDQTLDGFESDSVRYTGTGYANMVQVRLRTANSANQPTKTYDDADLLINPTAHTWTQVYPTPAAATAPMAPTAVSAVAGNASATVTWTAPTNNGGSAISGYNVQYSADGGTTYTSASAAFNTSTATTETVTGLTNGTPYVFRVAAINSAGTGAYSTASTAVTPVAPTVPAAPTGVSAVAGDAFATVSWTAPTDNGGRSIVGYDVQYSSDAGTTWTSSSAAFNTNTATTEKVTGLTNGTSYEFRVAAINSVGTSAYSSPSTAVEPVADATTLTISGPTAANYGATVTLAGVLTDSTTRKALGSQTVSLYRRASKSTSFALVKSVKTSSSGVARYAFRASANGQYEWRFAASSSHHGATSSVRTLSVAQTVSIARTPSSVKHGKTIKIYGAVNPSGSGKISLQSDVKGKWRTAGTATIKRQKLPNRKTEVGYVFTVKLPKKGTYTYRVYKTATSTLAAGYSGKISARAT